MHVCLKELFTRITVLMDNIHQNAANEQAVVVHTFNPSRGNRSLSSWPDWSTER